MVRAHGWCAGPGETCTALSVVVTIRKEVEGTNGRSLILTRPTFGVLLPRSFVLVPSPRTAISTTCIRFTGP